MKGCGAFVWSKRLFSRFDWRIRLDVAVFSVAEGGGAADDGDRDESGDQAVLDGGGAALVVFEVWCANSHGIPMSLVRTILTFQIFLYHKL